MISRVLDTGAGLVWLYQGYHWLRFGLWQQVTVLDGLPIVGITLQLPEIEWKGVRALVHGSILWIADLNLGLFLFGSALMVMLVESLVCKQYQRLDRKLALRRVSKRRKGLGYED